MSCSVCLFGDSVAKGVIFDSIRQKYRVLKDCFAASIQAKEHLAVTNYSKFGCTIDKGREILQRHAEELPSYDFVVFEFGGNDCDFDWHDVAEHPDQPHEAKTPLETFERSYREAVRFARANGGNPVLLTLPPIDAQRYFKWISRGEDTGAILKWLGDVDRIYRWHEMYNLAVCRVAMREHALLLDISSSFLERSGYQDLLCEDGIHPNEKGHDVIFESLRQAAHSAAQLGGHKTPRLALA